MNGRATTWGNPNYLARLCGFRALPTVLAVLLYLALHNARYVNTKENILADYLSRHSSPGYLPKFFDLCAHLGLTPIRVQIPSRSRGLLLRVLNGIAMDPATAPTPPMPPALAAHAASLAALHESFSPSYLSAASSSLPR